MAYVAHRFSGCTIIVTGGGAGIGRATVVRLGAEDARVIAVDVSEDRLARLTDEVEGDITPIAADITDPASTAQILEAAGRQPRGSERSRRGR